MAVWGRFQDLVEQRLSEGNIVAGEPQWKVVRPAAEASRFTIRGSGYASSSLECSLDADSGVLKCGCAGSGGELLSWHLVEGTADTLRQDGVDYTIGQAVNLALDKLVWPDDCGDWDRV